MNTIKHKIKFSLVLNDCEVSFQIFEMDERFRYNGIDTNTPEFTSINGFKIISNTFPDIFQNTIFLRGDDRNKDFDIQKNKFSNHEEAIFYFNNILIAIEDWAKNWNGWNIPNKEKDDFDNIYTF